METQKTTSGEIKKGEKEKQVVQKFQMKNFMLRSRLTKRFKDAWFVVML